MNTAILAVDDDILVLNSLRIQLERRFGQEYVLEFAQHVDEAIELIEELHNGEIKLIVIISDWIMPGKNGDVLAQYVKNMNPEIKVVVLSGQLQESIAQQMIDSKEIDSIVSKPWSEDHLIGIIENAIQSGK
jgi:DNA-binding NtrC family response regulator